VELGSGEIVAAGEAHEQAFKYAIKRIHGEAAMAGGHGVVGVHVERRVYSTHIEISLLGTAVRPVGAKRWTRVPSSSRTYRRATSRC